MLTGQIQCFLDDFFSILKDGEQNQTFKQILISRGLIIRHGFGVDVIAATVVILTDAIRKTNTKPE